MTDNVQILLFLHSYATLVQINLFCNKSCRQIAIQNLGEITVIYNAFMSLTIQNVCALL